MVKAEECIAPGVLADWELEAYRDGVAGPHVAVHLARCPVCQHRLQKHI